jgi:hypothetical protein
MNNPYDLHQWSTQYREEALQEARTRHLVDSARAGGHKRLSGISLVGLAWTNALSQLHRVLSA